MNKVEYRKACSYARKLTGDYRDIVHDAFLDHFNRTGNNLFDSPNRTIVVTVRNHWYNSVRGNRFMYKGVYYPKKFIQMNAPGLVENTTQENYVELKFGFHTADQVFEEICLRDELNLVKANVTKRQAELLDEAIKGFTIMDLADMEGVNQSSIRKSFKYIKEEAQKLLSQND